MAERREALIEELEGRFSWWGRFRGSWRVLSRQTFWFAFVQFAAGMKRLFDIVLAGALLTLCLPVFLLLALAAGGAGRLLCTQTRLGRWAEPYEEFSFSPDHPRLGNIIRALGLQRLPILINIFHGDCSFVGPRAVAPGELDPAEREIRRRFDVKPGLVCLWWIRTRANIAFDGEAASDAEYAESAGLKKDAGILLRALPALLYGENLQPARDHLSILNIPLDNVTMTGAIDRILALLRGNAPQQLCFINADCANIACTDPEYLAILQSGTMNLADGIGLKLAGNVLGREIRQNVNGTDLYPRLMQAIAGTGLRVYFLGAKPGVTDDLVKNLERDTPGVAVAGHRNGYFTPEEEPAVIEAIAAARADLLLVAFGAPRQDTWIAKHLARLNVKVAMGVGGLFDFYSGRTRRAPPWMREVGLEWLYRFWQEPGRMWKRYFVGNAVFLYRVFREKTGSFPVSCSPGQAEPGAKGESS